MPNLPKIPLRYIFEEAKGYLDEFQDPVPSDAKTEDCELVQAVGVITFKTSQQGIEVLELVVYEDATILVRASRNTVDRASIAAFGRAHAMLREVERAVGI